jgi:hypothetical protein
MRTSPDVGDRMHPRMAHQQSEFAGHKTDADTLQRHDLPGALAELLDDILGLENGRFVRHLLNTVAGSIFVTLTIADTAEIAHMNNVNAKRERANPGVITKGSGEFRLR